MINELKEPKKKRRKSFINKAIELGLVKRERIFKGFSTLISTSDEEDVTNEWESLKQFVDNNKNQHIHLDLNKKLIDDTKHILLEKVKVLNFGVWKIRTDFRNNEFVAICENCGKELTKFKFMACETGFFYCSNECSKGDVMKKKELIKK